MDIEEFRKELIDEIRIESESEGSDPESMFIEKTLNELEEIGELNDPIPMSIYRRGHGSRILAFDAYAYDVADASLVLIASDFSNQREVVPRLTNGRVEELYAHMLNFIDEAVNGTLSMYCDETDDAILIGEEFKKKIGQSMDTTEIMRFKFVILSDAVLSTQVKDLSRLDFLGRPVELNVWTIDRFYQIYISGSDEVMEINTKDFDCDGIQTMKANVGGIDDSYLCVMPGKLIAGIYLRYGTKVMQNHLGSFKGMRNKNNKGVRQSVINRPKQFFELNNGIVAIAKEVKIDNNNIVAIKDFQIINGCQTIMVLASAIMRHETRNDLADLFVPMKLIVVKTSDYKYEYQNDKYREFASMLSDSSHSQLSIINIDFYSNHPFHILMEKLSRKVLAPPANGCPYQTMWFYERSRGKWEQEQFKMTLPQIRRFCETAPKKQLIKKEKLAKCYNAILMNPHQVCQSSSINFIRFTDFVENMYNNHRDDINEDFYKKCVCSVIMFDTLDNLINNASWYSKGSHKAQIIPYAISKLIYTLPTEKDIDWNCIWKKQKLYPELEKELQRVAFVTHEFLKEKAGEQLIRTVSRLSSTWNEYKSVPYELNDRFQNTLIMK